MSPRRAVPSVPATGFARSASRSHVGHLRQVNEDRVLDAPELGLWAVSDGMGGYHGGDLAAQDVIDRLRRLGNADTTLTPAAVLRALEAANSAIFERDRGTGATVVVLSIHDSYAHLAWAGDSRCYRVRDGLVQQLTRDHSVVQELIDAGLISADTAATHPQANVITRALGVNRMCDFDTCLIDLRPSDRFLLCSDGLSRTLRSNDLIDDAIDSLADALLANALARDGTDNISFVLAEFGS